MFTPADDAEGINLLGQAACQFTVRELVDGADGDQRDEFVAELIRRIDGRDAERFVAEERP